MHWHSTPIATQTNYVFFVHAEILKVQLRKAPVFADKFGWPFAKRRVLLIQLSSGYHIVLLEATIRPASDSRKAMPENKLF